MKTKTSNLSVYLSEPSSYRYEFVTEVNDEVERRYTRISEVQEVSFIERTSTEIQQAELVIVEAEIEKVKEVTLAKLEELETRKQELLSLSFLEQ